MRGLIEYPAPAANPRTGLLATLGALGYVTEDTGVDSLRWLDDGAEYQPPACPTSVSDRVSIDVCNGGNLPDLTTVRPTLSASSFVVVGEEVCSTFGHGGRDYEADARLALTRTLSYQVAAELASGTVRGPGTLGEVGPYFDADDVYADNDGLFDCTAKAKPLEAFAVMEDSLATMATNGPGLIHMPPHLLAVMVATEVVRRENGQWLTPTDNVVVSDGGYGPGSVATVKGSANWMIGTGPIYAHLGPVEVLGGLNVPSTVIADNTVKVWATRPVLLLADYCAWTCVTVTAPYGA